MQFQGHGTLCHSPAKKREYGLSIYPFLLNYNGEFVDIVSACSFRFQAERQGNWKKLQEKTPSSYQKRGF